MVQNVSTTHMIDGSQKTQLIDDVGNVANLTANALDVNVAAGMVDVTALATAANQTNAAQKTQIVDGAGAVIGATSNAIDINIKSTAVQQGWNYAGSGVPSSSPSPPDGIVPKYYDYTNNVTYIWVGAAWHEYTSIIDGGEL